MLKIETGTSTYTDSVLGYMMIGLGRSIQIPFLKLHKVLNQVNFVFNIRKVKQLYNNNNNFTKTEKITLFGYFFNTMKDKMSFRFFKQAFDRKL